MMERFWIYTSRVSVPGNKLLDSVTVPMDGDAPFAMRAMGSESGSSAEVRTLRADDSYFQSGLVNCFLFHTFSQTPNFGPIYPQLVYPAGGQLKYDVNNLSGGTLAHVMYFRGAKLYPDGALPAPPYPRKYREIPYHCNTTFTVKNGAVPNLYDLPIFPNMPYVFALRSLQYAVDANSPAFPSDLRIRLKDQWGHYFSNDYIRIQNIALSFAADIPGLIVPEILIPAGGSIFFDVFQAGTPGADVIIQLTADGALLQEVS